MNRESIQKETLGKIQELPALSTVATELMKVLQSPDVSIKEVAELIGQDPGLTTKILQVANSAYYGVSKTIANIQNAVVLLGIKTVNSLVLSLSVQEALPTSSQKTLFSTKKYWIQSFICATLNKKIAEQNPDIKVDPEEAFCSGLLHNIGLLAFSQVFPEVYDKVLRELKQGKATLHELEEKQFGCTHVKASVYLAEKWKLPESISIPMNYYLTPAEAPSHSNLSHLSYLSHRLTQKITPPPFEDPTEQPIDSTIYEVLSLSTKFVDELSDTVQEEVEAIEGAFQLSS